MPAVVRITPGQLGAVIRSAAKRNRAAVAKAAMRAATRGVALLTKRSPVDQGIFKSLWRAVRDGLGARIENTAPHAGIIERGARPHMPPVAPLVAWVARHASKLGLRTPAEIESAAWGIAKKISREGQKPTWLVRKSLPELRAFLREEIDRGLAEANRGAQ